MKKLLSLSLLIIVALTSCQKKVDAIKENILNGGEGTPNTKEFVQYVIPQGQQFSNYSSYTKVTIETLSFIVKFDSSAIYTTANPFNQNDINKLFGFSDNNAQHHEFSARIGWRWSNNALRLFAYVYNNGQMNFKEITTVALGAENSCSIKVNGDTYIFTVNGTAVTMPRASATPQAIGYRLFPYFGGDELAPHTISIWIKEL